MIIPSLDESGPPWAGQEIFFASDGTTPSNTGISVTGGHLATDSGTRVVLDNTDSAATIKQLRQAEILQSFWEKVNRVGDHISDFMNAIW